MGSHCGGRGRSLRRIAVAGHFLANNGRHTYLLGVGLLAVLVNSVVDRSSVSEVFREMEEAIVKDLLVKKMGRILYTDLGVVISCHVLDGSNVVWRKCWRKWTFGTSRPVAGGSRRRTHLCV